MGSGVVFRGNSSFILKKKRLFQPLHGSYQAGGSQSLSKTNSDGRIHAIHNAMTIACWSMASGAKN